MIITINRTKKTWQIREESSFHLKPRRCIVLVSGEEGGGQFVPLAKCLDEQI